MILRQRMLHSASPYWDRIMMKVHQVHMKITRNWIEIVHKVKMIRMNSGTKARTALQMKMIILYVTKKCFYIIVPLEIDATTQNQ